MKLYIDGKVETLTLDADKDLLGNLDIVKKRLGNTNRIIRTITIDGVLLSQKSENKLDKKKISLIKEIKVTTSTPLPLAIQTLDNAGIYISSFIKEVEDFSDALQSGAQEEDYDKFIGSLRGMTSIVQLLSMVKDMLKLDFAKIKVSNESLEKINAKLEDVLAKIVKAFKKQDWIYLQDMLRYELVPVLEKVKLQLKEIKNIASKKSV